MTVHLAEEAPRFVKVRGRGHPGRLSPASLCLEAYEPRDTACDIGFSSCRIDILVATLHGYGRVSDDMMNAIVIVGTYEFIFTNVF